MAQLSGKGGSQIYTEEIVARTMQAACALATATPDSHVLIRTSSFAQIFHASHRLSCAATSANPLHTSQALLEKALVENARLKVRSIIAVVGVLLLSQCYTRLLSSRCVRCARVSPAGHANTCERHGGAGYKRCPGDPSFRTRWCGIRGCSGRAVAVLRAVRSHSLCRKLNVTETGRPRAKFKVQSFRP